MTINVVEIFSSLQGEGVHTGIPTTFIRLAGCNLSCEWCDTEYAMDLSSGISMDVGDILSSVKKEGLRMVCLTGGEPMFQAETLDLVDTLLENDYSVDLETNGSYDLTGISGLRGGPENLMLSVDVKTPSSGEEGSFNERNLSLMKRDDQLKFIIRDERDLDMALGFLEDHEVRSNVIITPCHNENADTIADLLMQRMENMGKKNGTTMEHDWRDRVRMMVQMHKVIWGNDRKCV